MLLADLVSPVRRLALFGLAKNTGKTVTLGAVVRALEARGHTVGVTSIGRDGEQTDVLNRDIHKPRIDLPTRSLVATTDALMRKSGLRHELLARTAFRTPLGQVVIARLAESGSVEVAGPNAVADVKSVCATMAWHGVDRVLIDGALNRKAAASPRIADGVVLSTGAVLHTELDEVVRATREAVEVLLLPTVEDEALRAIASAVRGTALIADDATIVGIATAVALASSPAAVAALLRAHPRASDIVVRGALCESFVENVLHAARGREIRFVVGDATKVFLSRRSYGWYRSQGLSIEVLESTRLRAITVNPVSPESHRFDARSFRERLAAAIPDVHVFDVMEPC